MLYLCEEENYVRLPTIVKPTHYELFLNFNFAKFDFEGEVTICIEVLRRTKELQLNSSALEIESIKLINAKNGITFEPDQNDYSKKNEINTLHFANPITIGNYRLKIKYQGFMSDEPKGLFYSLQTTSEKEENDIKVTIFSNFEPIYARRVFPCFDEPSFKTTFRIVLIVPKQYKALSNMPLDYSELLGKTRRFWFKVTPPMSTYLVALTVGDFSRIEETTPKGISVGMNVIGGRTKQERGKFALEIAIKALRFFENYFKTPFPLPKLDMVVLQGFQLGVDAMDNWGLITFREINVLIDPEDSSNLTKRWIALLVCHQIAHQWFGNLVTIEWWSQTWFYESLCHLAENACVDYFYPQFEIWQHFYLESTRVALQFDEFVDKAHPVEIVVKFPTDSYGIFDGISYNKGAAVMRMLYDYVGEENFRKAMWMFLDVHAFKNSNADDFFGALKAVTEKPIWGMMKPWIKQEGFPVVRVTMAIGCECKLKQDDVRIKLTQSRFVNASSKGKPENETQLWKIPISLITSKNPKEEITLIMDGKENEFLIPDIRQHDWIKVNPGCVGFYRVQYSTELLKRLMPAIRKKEIAALDRIGILDDLFHLVKNGYTNTGVILKFLNAYDEETEFLVWSTISKILNKLSILLSNTDFEEDFNKYQQKLMSKAAKTLGWDKKNNEDRFDHMVRKLILGQMSWLEDENMIKEARKRFETTENSLEEKFPDGLKMACYRTIVRSGGEAEFDSLIKLYKTVDNYEERKSICEALGSSKDEKILKKVLTFAMSCKTRPSDTILIVTALSFTKTGRDLLWDYYRRHWRDILDKINDKEALSGMLREITEKYATEQKVIEIEEFFNKEMPCDEATLQRALETLRSNAIWLERDSEAMQEFFKKN